jgi:hypothetical protein
MQIVGCCWSRGKILIFMLRLINGALLRHAYARVIPTLLIIYKKWPKAKVQLFCPVSLESSNLWYGTNQNQKFFQNGVLQPYGGGPAFFMSNISNQVS